MNFQLLPPFPFPFSPPNPSSHPCTTPWKCGFFCSKFLYSSMCFRESKELPTFATFSFPIFLPKSLFPFPVQPPRMSCPIIPPWLCFCGIFASQRSFEARKAQLTAHSSPQLIEKGIEGYFYSVWRQQNIFFAGGSCLAQSERDNPENSSWGTSGHGRDPGIQGCQAWSYSYCNILGGKKGIWDLTHSWKKHWQIPKEG